MKRHSLTALLKSFTKEEIQLFADYISSPYFNRRKAVIKLFRVIIKFYPAFDDVNFTKKHLFTAVFPGKNYNDSSIRVIISRLNELAFDFLVQRNFEENNPESNLIRIKTMFKRNYFKNGESFIERSLRSLYENTPLAEDRFYFEHNFFEMKKSFLQINNSGIIDKKLDKLEFTNSIECFTNYFYIRTLKTYIIILNIKILYNRDYDTTFLENIYNTIEMKIIRKYPVIEIYYLIVILLKDTANEDAYFRAKNLFYKNLNSFNKSDKEEILINLGNFASRKISEGAESFRKEKFELLKKEIEQKTFNINGYMTFVYYKTVVSMALIMKDVSFAKMFIVDYAVYLSGESRNNSYYYCSAMYEFYMKNYNNALEQLSKVNFPDLYSKLDLKVFQIVIFYEMNYDEALLSSIESFRHFLNNNKLITKNKHPYYFNFYRAVKKLTALRNTKDEFEINLFIKNFLNKHMFINKVWIREKLDNLKA
ncbi:MAG TPA: hypothetical protein PK536_03695 [Ignavibacteria bacterium]|nr:hypothetical protein [Bacteroidota bacterium]HRI84528.1 hypothetical protein [Ignavibacteria bacterium]HRJ99383.1 hypothetical protein [Ignavibacteria bacterium]